MFQTQTLESLARHAIIPLCPLIVLPLLKIKSTFIKQEFKQEILRYEAFATVDLQVIFPSACIMLYIVYK